MHSTFPGGVPIDPARSTPPEVRAARTAGGNGLMRNARLIAVLVAVGAVAACHGTRYTTVTIPPRLELGQYGRAALTTFSVENAKGSLNELATRRFAESVLRAQRDVEVLEVGTVDETLEKVGESTFGPAAAKAFGSDRDVPVVFAGHMKVSNVRPSGGLTSLAVPHLEATISVELDVALYSSRTGGTIWRAGSTASEKVGQVSMSGNLPTFSAKDPNAAYGRLVDRLIAEVSQDLYPTFERRVVR